MIILTNQAFVYNGALKNRQKYLMLIFNFQVIEFTWNCKILVTTFFFNQCHR